MRRVMVWVMGLLVLLVVGGVLAIELRTRSGAERAQAEFDSYEPPVIGDFGTTKTLTVLPLIDWHVASPDLRGEMGVSYLIETDEHRILFDVGQNTRQESPSPLEHNMEALGVRVEDIDTVFISHNHFDHVGGKPRQADRTFSIGLEQVDLPDARAFVPIAMTYPGLSPVHAAAPTQIGNGVASTGTIPRQLAFGWIDEQALVIHVEGIGGVLIVGCGHQTISKLLQRYDAVFDEPLYGVVGGLHYPVPTGRLKILGLDAQRRMASGEGMFAVLTMEDVKADLAALEARKLGVVGVGGHDSSDEVIAMFSDTFDDAYRHIRVGEPIVIGPPN